jgi:hypothetical protein
MLHPHPQSCHLTLATATTNTSLIPSLQYQVYKPSKLPPLSVTINDATVDIRMADISQSLGKKLTKSLLLGRTSASNLDVHLVASQPPIPASHHRQPLKQHRRIFASCEKWSDNLENSLRELMNLTQTRKLRRPMNIFIPQSVKSTLATYNELEDFMCLRVTFVQCKKVVHLQSPHTSWRLSLWPIPQDPALLLSFPLMRTQST